MSLYLKMGTDRTSEVVVATLPEGALLPDLDAVERPLFLDFGCSVTNHGHRCPNEACEVLEALEGRANTERHRSQWTVRELERSIPSSQFRL